VQKKRGEEEKGKEKGEGREKDVEQGDDQLNHFCRGPRIEAGEKWEE